MVNYGSMRCLIIVSLLFGGVVSADPLHDAAQVGDIDTLKRLLSSGADVNARTISGTTVLMTAARYGHEAIVSALLAAGADVNALDDGRTALNSAVQNGHEAIVSALLAAGTDPNAKRRGDGATALSSAVQNGHEAMFSALLAAGADPDATALRLAAQNGHEAIVSALLAAGADPGAAALIVATYSGHEAIVSALLAAGTDPNAKLNDGRTALSLAVQNGHEAIVSALLAAGAEAGDLGWKGRKKPKPRQEDAYSKIRTVSVEVRPRKLARVPQWLTESLESRVVDFFTERNIEVVHGSADLSILVDRIDYSVDYVPKEIYAKMGYETGRMLRGRLILKHSNRKIKKYEMWFKGSQRGPWTCFSRQEGGILLHCKEYGIRGDLFVSRLSWKWRTAFRR